MIHYTYLTKISRYDPDPDPAGSIIVWPFGSGSAIQDYGSKDPRPKEIFTDPQHRIQPFLTM